MRFVFLGLGLLAPALTLLFAPPAGFAPEAWKVAWIALMMALWWMTGALPLAVTALSPLLLAPVLGVDRLAAVAAA